MEDGFLWRITFYGILLSVVETFVFYLLFRLSLIEDDISEREEGEDEPEIEDSDNESQSSYTLVKKKSPTPVKFCSIFSVSF